MSQSIRQRSYLTTLAVLLLAASTPVLSFQPPSKLIHLKRAHQHSQVRWKINSNYHKEKQRSCLYGVIEDIEQQAKNAGEAWSVEATAFLEPDVASQVEEKFRDRGDVVAFRILGGRRLAPTSSDEISKGEGRRSRFVFMHPDLGLDAATAEAEYCTVILVENVNLKASNTLPNALAGIGIDLDQVGDIVVVDHSTVYLVVNPVVAKQCLRLLSKELVGVGISLSVVDEHEFMPEGDIQEMKLSRILERKMDRKKYEQGYVQFS